MQTTSARPLTASEASWLLSFQCIPMSPEEADDFSAWLNMHTSDPYEMYEDPVIAFRIDKLTLRSQAQS